MDRAGEKGDHCLANHGALGGKKENCLWGKRARKKEPNAMMLVREGSSRGGGASSAEGEKKKVHLL